MPLPNASDTSQSMVVSYIAIRRAIGLSGLLLPIALGLGGLAIGIPIQDNISSYYHTPLRYIFVGTMAAMGGYMVLIPIAWKRWLNAWNFLFWLECVAVWAFAAAWLTKGHAIFAEIGVELLSIPIRILNRAKGDGGFSRILP